MFGSPWAESDVERLKELVSSGATKEEAADALNCSVYRVGHKATRLGLVFSNSLVWTDDDVAKMEELANQGKNVAQIAKSLGRTSSAVQAKAYKCGVPVTSSPKRGTAPKKSRKRWTEQDDAELKRLINVEKCSVEAAADVLGRSPSAISVRMCALGLGLREARRG